MPATARGWVNVTYSLLAAAINHPDPVNPYFGLFNARSIEAITKRGVEVDVVTPRPYAPPIGPYSEYREIPRTSFHDGYQVHHPRFFYGLPKRLFYGLAGQSYAKRVPSYVEQTFDEPDVVHAYHIYPDGYGMAPYCEKHDLPLIVVAHGAAMNDFDELPRGVRTKIRETMETSEVVLCVSRALAEKAELHVPGVNTEIVSIGADPSTYPLEEEDRIRAEMGIPADRPVVFFCGQFVERKGVREIVEVLPELADVDAHFLFVGQSGPLLDPLEQRLHDLDLGEKATVMSDVPDRIVRKCFVVADLVLLPSHDEGRPTVVYEAMASRTAVLASNVGGIPEQVADGETGRLLPPGDAAALEGALRELIADRDMLLTFGERGYRRLIENGWTWAQHARHLERIHCAAIS